MLFVSLVSLVLVGAVTPAPTGTTEWELITDPEWQPTTDREWEPTTDRDWVPTTGPDVTSSSVPSDSICDEVS